MHPSVRLREADVRAGGTGRPTGDAAEAGRLRLLNRVPSPAAEAGRQGLTGSSPPNGGRVGRWPAGGTTSQYHRRQSLWSPPWLRSSLSRAVRLYGPAPRDGANARTLGGCDVTLGNHLGYVTMTHFKRGYPATRAKTRPRLFTTPARWNIEFHNRPRRRRNRLTCHAVVQGADVDELLWPLEKKPHHYYW
jgi:hypothetical protein